MDDFTVAQYEFSKTETSPPQITVSSPQINNNPWGYSLFDDCINLYCTNNNDEEFKISVLQEDVELFPESNDTHSLDTLNFAYQLCQDLIGDQDTVH